MQHHISFYLLHFLKPIPLQQHFHLYEQKKVWQIRGLWQLWDLMFSQDVPDNVGRVGGVVVVVQLPVTSLPQCRSLAPHCIMQPTKNFNAVLLENSLTIWCIIMVNETFVIKENHQPHFHLAPNMAYLFWPQRPQSLPL